MISTYVIFTLNAVIHSLQQSAWQRIQLQNCALHASCVEEREMKKIILRLVKDEEWVQGEVGKKLMLLICLNNHFHKFPP